MDVDALAALRTQVLWAAFLVAVFFGWVVQRSHFCTMGAINDVVNMGDSTRARSWAGAVATATLGLWGMHALGWVDPAQSIYANGRIIVASALVGGAFFGFGMVLASGCGSKTLVRIGAGSLKSLTVFVVMGVVAYATLRGVTAVLRDQTLDRLSMTLDTSLIPVWVARWTGADATQVGLLMAIAVFALVWLWILSDPAFRRSSQVFWSLCLGLSVVAMWWVSGSLGFVAEHPETLEPAFVATNSQSMEALTFTAPMAYTLHWLILFSDLSNVLTISVVCVLGVVVGSFIENLRAKTFRIEGFSSTQDTALHLVGAACMGFGGVTAMGCTVGQGLSGMSTLSITSVLALVGIVAGGVAGLKYQMWLVMRD
jgi:uncharacterized protein